MVPVRRHVRMWRKYVACGGLILGLFYSVPSRNETRGAAEGTEQGSPVERLLHTDPKSYASEQTPATHDNENSLKWTDVVNTILTGVLAFSTIGLWIATHRLFRAGEKQLGLTEKSINIALHSMDRPWLVIEEVSHNRDTWRDDGKFFAEFSITNYGTAPAIINGIRGIFFFSPGRNRMPDDMRAAMPPHVRDFPDPSNYQQFMSQWGRIPGVRHLSESNSSQDDEAVRRFSRHDRGPTIILPSGERTEAVQFYEPAQIIIAEGSMPIEFALDCFLIGWVVYTLPDERMETISFCYQGNFQGGFAMVGGKPYNERKPYGNYELARSI